MATDNLVRMLEKAADISIKDRVKTFFDVSGYPHYENVMSNILAFFFDPSEEHSQKDLWLKSLFDCYNEKALTDFKPGEVEEIKREHATEENKRLDIIISIDNMVVAIENKIYATPYNPFDMYHNEIMSFCKNEGKQIIEILLSLKPEENQKTKYNTTFYNITYKALITAVKKNLGDYIEEANEKWLIFMKDLLNNIENLGEKDNMNTEWQKFLKENGENMSKFFDNYMKDIHDKITFISDLTERVNELLKHSNLTCSAETYHVKNSGSFKGHISLFIDIPKGDNKFVIEPYIMKNDPAYLVIALWNRNEKKTKYDWINELELFNKDYPNAVVADDYTWGKFIKFESIDFEKNIPIDRVAEKILQIAKKII